MAKGVVGFVLKSYSCAMKIPVRYNHVGYAPQCAKIFFVNTKDLPCDGLAVDDYFFRIVKVGRGVDGVRGPF